MDFLSVGELLIDFSPFQAAETAQPLFQLNPGGAPANVACVLAKLGHSSAFTGKVGNDFFGQSCIDTLRAAGVETSYIFRSSHSPTTLAFVTLDHTGNRSFSFYRSGTADVELTVEELQSIPLDGVKLFHFGSVSLTAQPARNATLSLVERAREAGCLISYDPNLRLSLWSSEEEACRVIQETAPLADILKLSEEEAEFLFGPADAASYCRRAQTAFNVPIVLVTRGPLGCVCAAAEQLLASSTYDVTAVDTTGAGDAFLGGVLHCLMSYGKAPQALSDEELAYTLDFGNAAGSLTTTQKGAINAIPSLDEIEQCMRTAKKATTH